jgi:hypothetical protein
MNISPVLPLRVGLGIMYAYSGMDLLRNPDNWIAFIPGWLMDIIVNIISLEIFLRVQGAIELVFAVSFLLFFLPNWWVRMTAIFSAIEMLSILVLTGVDLVTFRDFGLLGASVALIIFLGSQTKFVHEREVVNKT